MNLTKNNYLKIAYAGWCGLGFYRGIKAYIILTINITKMSLICIYIRLVMDVGDRFIISFRYSFQ